MNITYIEYNTDYASIPKRNEGGAERINDINTAQNSELHACGCNHCDEVSFRVSSTKKQRYKTNCDSAIRIQVHFW